jgi:glycosyltransferase involved in cell wall biosynthesis
MPSPTSHRPVVVHFVTGGFSGATQVAVDLCLAAQASGAFAPVLVLRRKRHTPMARVEALRARGLEVHLVTGIAHLATIAALARLLRRLQPAALLAHGFPEHLIGRHAGRLARVPALLQVEHNTRERYTAWSRAQARCLAPQTAALVGVSEGVRQVLLRQGLPPDKTLAIPNGIDLARFEAAGGVSFESRAVGVLMSARFARQKDQPTLIRAVGLLRDRGLTLPLALAGIGKPGLERHARQLVTQLGLEAQVDFLGHVGDLPQRLMEMRNFVLATHWEGMPLALVEAMAAGCACVASEVDGVQGVIEHERTGLLVAEGDAEGLARALERLLTEPGLAERLGTAARERALAEHGLGLMLSRYEALLSRLLASRHQ